MSSATSSGTPSGRRSWQGSSPLPEAGALSTIRFSPFIISPPRTAPVIRTFFGAEISFCPSPPLFRLSGNCPQPFFFSAFRWRKAAKATRPIPLSASERLKAASGDCAGLQANRPRRCRFQPFRPLFRHRNQVGNRLAEKRKTDSRKSRWKLAVGVNWYVTLCRPWRHNKSALSFDAEKEGAGCGSSATGWRIGLILRAPCSAAPRAIPRKTTCGGFWYFWPQKYIKNFFSAFRWRKAAKATRPIPMPASERLKAASGDCAGLQANRPRRCRFQPSVRSFAIGTKSGIAMRETKRDALPDGNFRKSKLIRASGAHCHI